MNKNNKSKRLPLILVGFLILAVILVIYMKHTNNCGLLGGYLENVAGKFICKPNPAHTIAPMGDASSTMPPASVDQNTSLTDTSKPTESDLPVAPVVTEDVTNSLPKPEDAQADTGIINSEVGIVNPNASTETNVANVSNANNIIDTTSTTNSPAAPVNFSEPAAPTATSGQAAQLQSSYETPALLVADNKLRITSSIPGKIQSIAYKDGQEFKKDDILITFDCRNIELDLDIQRAELKEKEESLKDLKKLQELKSASAYSVVKAESQVEQSRKAIEKYEYQLSTCIIKADYAGKIISRQVNENQYVQAGQEIMTVNNSSELLVKAYVPVTWLTWLKEGTSFELCFEKNNCYNGVVNRLGGEVDAISQTLDIFGKITSENTQGLIAGLSGQVKFDKS